MNNLFIIYYLLFISNSTQSNLKMSEQNVQEIVYDGNSAKCSKQDLFGCLEPENVVCKEHNITHQCTVSCDECLSKSICEEKEEKEEKEARNKAISELMHTLTHNSIDRVSKCGVEISKLAAEFEYDVNFLFRNPV